MKSAQCFTWDMMVMTDKGYKKISSLEAGDNVFTGSGKLTRVKHIIKQDSNDIYSIKTRPGLLKETLATGNHKMIIIPFRRNRKHNRYSNTNDFKYVFKTENIKEVAVKDIQKGDFLLMPKPKMNITKSNHTKDYCRLLGLYASEGYVRKDGCGRFGFCFNINETEYIDFVYKNIKNCDWRKKNVRTDNCTVVEGKSKGLCKELAELCGIGCINKKVPAFLFKDTDNNKKAFIRGAFEGDGCQIKREVVKQYKYTSISQDLVYGMQFLLKTLGIIASIQGYPARPNRKKVYNLVVSGRYAQKAYDEIFKDVTRFDAPERTTKSNIVEWDNYFAVRVSEIHKTNESDYVYNIETESDEHSYTVNGVSCKNCGVSEWLLNTAFWLADCQSFNSTLVEPADPELRDFVHGRVKPAIDGSPHLLERVNDTDNVGLKRIGRAFIYFRGSRRPHKLKTIDSDCMLYDELDELSPGTLARGAKRLGHSELKWQRAVSTPTYPETGIDEVFAQSDQMNWIIKCEHCNTFQTLSWPENIDIELGVVVCKKCKKPIDRCQDGEWIAKYPEREIRGYHINKLFCARTSIKDLITSSKKIAQYEVQEFFNSDLGIPYAPQGDRLSKTAIRSCVDGNYDIPYPVTGCTMGVDVGRVLNVKISIAEGNKQRCVYVNTLNDFEELDDLMYLYGVDTCVIDANPETRKAKELQARFQGRVYLAYYLPSDDKRTELLRIDEDEDEGDLVKINRTQAADNVVANFMKRRYILPRNAEVTKDYFTQLMAPMRIVKKDARGNEVAVYEEFGKPDHYFHAEIYDFIATKIRNHQGVTFVKGSVSSKSRDMDAPRTSERDAAVMEDNYVEQVW